MGVIYQFLPHQQRKKTHMSSEPLVRSINLIILLIIVKTHMGLEPLVQRVNLIIVLIIVQIFDLIRISLMDQQIQEGDPLKCCCCDRCIGHLQD